MDCIARRSIDSVTLLRRFSNDGQGIYIGMLGQSRETSTVVPATGTAIEMAEVRRSSHDPGVSGHLTGHSKDGDAPARGEVE